MKQSDFDALKNGDHVVFTGITDFDGCLAEEFPDVGTVFTREESWLCDGDTNRFTWEVDGVSDFHFFHANEVEFIKGELV